MANRALPRMPGFTLIELMVTLAVLSVVLVAALPSFADFFDKYRLRGAVDDVVSVVSNARAESVKTDRDVNITVGGAVANWCVGANAAATPAAGEEAVGATACDCVDDTPACRVAGQPLIVAAGKHAGVSVGAVGTTFSFDSKLGVITPLGTRSVTFRSPSNKYAMQLNVNALGQASVCRPATEPAIAGVQTCP
jgi:type IV fimbrial biogenesis protein FimT